MRVCLLLECCQPWPEWRAGGAAESCWPRLRWLISAPISGLPAGGHLPARSHCTFQALIKAFVSGGQYCHQEPLKSKFRTSVASAVGEEGACTPPVEPEGTYLPCQRPSQKEAVISAARGGGPYWQNWAGKNGGHNGRSGLTRTGGHTGRTGLTRRESYWENWAGMKPARPGGRRGHLETIEDFSDDGHKFQRLMREKTVSWQSRCS